MNINYVDTEIPEMAQFCSSGRQRLYVTVVCPITVHFCTKYVSITICMYVCMYVCVCVYIYIYICIQILQISCTKEEEEEGN